MAEENRVVVVENNTDCTVSIRLPDYNFRALWTKKGQKNKINFEDLSRVIFDMGVSNMFAQGILRIDNEKDRIDLGLEDETGIVKYNLLNDSQILSLLKIKSTDELEEKLKESPEEQRGIIADKAIELRISDKNKCDLIEKYCGVNVLRAVAFTDEMDK